MNILVIFDSFFPNYSGGRETGFYNISKTLQTEDVNFHCITKKHARHSNPFFEISHSNVSLDPIQAYRIYFSKLSSITGLFDSFVFPMRSYNRAKKVLENKKIHMILTFSSGLPALAASRVKKVFKIPFVINFRSYSSKELKRNKVYRPLYPLLKKIDEFNLLRSDLVLTNGNDTKELLDRIVHSKKKVKPIFNGVNTKKFVPRDKSKDVKPNEKLILVFAASLRPLKGLDHILRAISMLNKSLKKQVKLRVLGKGNTAKYKKLASELDVLNQVEFYGEVSHDNMPQILNTSNVAVLPYLYGMGLPHSALEAMSSGLALLAYDVQDFATVVKDRETGFLIPLKDVEGLSSRLAELINDRKLVQEMGNKARQEAQRYDWDSVAKRFFQYCKKAI